MQLVFLILADSAQVVEGKLYMLGGGWDRVWTDILPHNRPCSLAMGLTLAPDDVGPRHSFRLTVIAPGEEAERDLGRGEFEVGITPDPEEGMPPRVTAAFPLVLNLQQFGQSLVKLYIDDTEMGKIPFRVIQRSQ